MKVIGSFLRPDTHRMTVGGLKELNSLTILVTRLPLELRDARKSFSWGDGVVGRQVPTVVAKGTSLYYWAKD